MAKSPEKKRPQSESPGPSHATSNEAVTQQNTIKSPLLALPAEIRNQIFEYVLGGQTIHIHSARTSKTADGHRWRSFAQTPTPSFCYNICPLRGPDSSEAERIRDDEAEQDYFRYPQHHHRNGCAYLFTRETEILKLDLRLLQTCRQIYQEAAPLPFASNTFTFSHESALRHFTDALTETQRRDIRDVTLIVSFTRDFPSPKSVLRFSGLKKLTIYGGIANRTQGILGHPTEGIQMNIDWFKRMELLQKLPLTKATVCLTCDEPGMEDDRLPEDVVQQCREACRALEYRLVQGTGAGRSQQTHGKKRQKELRRQQRDEKRSRRGLRALKLGA